MTGQPATESDLVEPPFDLGLLSELIKAFARAVRAHQLYLPNNPMHARAIDTVRDAFRRVWAEVDKFALEITESELKWLGRSVLTEPGRTSDSIPWMMFKDGVRELTFYRGFEDTELLVLLTLMQRARLASVEDDDLLTLLWEHDFNQLQYSYIDVAVEGIAPLDSVRGEQPEKIVSPSSVEEAAQELVTSSITRMDAYDSTLYFLDDHEIEYLQSEIRRDFGSDLRAQVIASLLDTYEQETDPTVRDEIARILDNLFLLLLSLAQFRTAAFLIREAAVTAARAKEVVSVQSQRLIQLADRLSEKDALEQLLHALEETPLQPPQHDLHELFGQFKPAALETVLSWIGRSRNAALRALLESAGSRLASENAAELVRLISSEDEVVAFEAIRRAGAMKSGAAVVSLTAVIAHADPDLRLAAVAALSDIGSAGALQALERALTDEDRDIRIAAVKVLASRNHRTAIKAIEKHLRTRDLRESALAEKMAFFESYGLLAGDGGVPFLSGILNARTIIGRREDGELRACAAMALGKIGTGAAMIALQGSLADKDVLVRNAVSRAVRG